MGFAQMKSMGTQSSNELQRFDKNDKNHDSSPNNGRQVTFPIEVGTHNLATL